MTLHQSQNRRRAGALATVLALSIYAAGCSQEAPRAPAVTIAFSNDMLGEIRSCGCPINDYGGLGRRATFLNAVRDTTTADFLLLEGGGLFGTEINYGREKADLTLEAIALMDYDAMVIGKEELGFGVEYITTRTRELGVPVVVANLYDAGPDTLLFPAAREVTLASGLRVGIIGAMSRRMRLPPQVTPGSLRLTDPVAAVRRQAATLDPRCDLVVVVARMSRGEAEQLASAVPEIDLVVHGSRPRPMKRTRRTGNAYILQVGSSGHMGVAYAVLAEEGGIRWLRRTLVPLDVSFGDDEEIARLFDSYDLDIAVKEGAVAPSIRNAGKGASSPYVGAPECGSCHEAEYAQWEETPHAHAFEILTSRSREHDRDCVPCHTTGYREEGGYERLAVTPQLTSVQCEACHGNGHAHSNDPEVPTPAPARDACRGCHNAEQSPDFEFEAFWARIQH